MDNKKKEKSHLIFFRDRFIWYDFLLFSPIFIISIYSLIKLLFDKAFQLKREIFLAMLGIILLYSALYCLKSDPGTCFGDRFLIPIIPLMFFFSVFAFLKEENRALFKIFFWVQIPMLTMGAFSAWSKPSFLFVRFNLFLNLALSLFLFLYLIFKKQRSLSINCLSFFKEKKVFSILAISAVFFAEYFLF